ncbi:methionyl-tRNA formyltransferase [bacterium]|nr:MAG: methionyl-tRNA formyltransferase [bacterium]
MKIVIATIHSWNIQEARKFISKYPQAEVLLITDRGHLVHDKIRKFNPDYIFFPHWSWFIPENIYRNYECIVFHMTDLPYGRGGSPLQNLIVRGIYKTKISAIRVVKNIDAGPVYLKEVFCLEGSASDIFVRCSKIIFTKMIPQIILRTPMPCRQSGKVVKFKRRTAKQSNIASLNSLKKVYDYIRMLDAEGYPHAYLKFGALKVEFTDAKMSGSLLTAKAKIEVKNEK